MEKSKDINYFINLFKNKKLLLIIPSVLIFAITLIVAYSLPSVYESTSTILIEEQQIPQDFVRTTVTGFADQRIQSITQQILSRSKLMEIIKQFNLYQDMKDKYTQEEIIERMREDIRLNTISADVTDRGKKGKGAGSGGMTIAFTISYQGKNPATVQKVAGNLASLYLEQNLKDRQEKAETTTKFLEAELKALDERIASIGAQITKFKQTHEGALPELRGHNMAQAERLEVDIKQLDNQIRASSDKRAYLEGQLATINPDLPIVGQETVLDPKARLYALKVALATLLAKNSDDHPDVQKIKREIAGLEKMVSVQIGQASARRQKLLQLQMELAAKEGRLAPEHPEIKKLQKEIARLENTPDSPEPSPRPAEVRHPNNPSYIGIKNQIQAIDNEIAMLQKQQIDLRDKLKLYQQRMELAPTIEQEYMALLRDYQNAHSKHMEVMNKLLEARIAEGMEEHQKAEKFTLIDPAGFPEKPVSPNRLLIVLGGFFFGLATGAGMVLISDQLDHSIKNADDIIWITDLPVIGNISRMLPPEYLYKLKRRRIIIAATTCLSILLLLILVHFFYRDLWVLMAQLMRMFNKYT